MKTLKETHDEIWNKVWGCVCDTWLLTRNHVCVYMCKCNNIDNTLWDQIQLTIPGHIHE